MLLYKYVGLKRALYNFINESTFYFSSPALFNDPFELSEYFNDDELSSAQERYDFVHTMQNMGVLCLTKNPLNMLMWAHYASKDWNHTDDKIIELLMEDSGLLNKNTTHTGICIGIDPDAAGLNDPSINTVPATHGNVTYSTNKPNARYQESLFYKKSNGFSLNFDMENYHKLQGVFLNKPICWSYEEEVRVVRNIKSNNGSNVFPFPPESIKEIYLGLRHSSNIDFLIKINEIIENKLPNCTIFTTNIHGSKWELSKKNIFRNY